MTNRGSEAGRRIAVVLVRPREEGNVGAVARAMANMGLSELVLVEPAPPIGGVAKGFGVGGWHVLDGVRRVASLEEAVADFHRVVGTTALRERARRRARLVDPRELAEILAQDPPETSTALVFGPEDTGLTRPELERTSPVVRIPTAAEHPTLNLSQAVLVVAWELHRTTAGVEASSSVLSSDREPPATAAEVEGLLEAASAVLDRSGFDQPRIKRSLLADLRRLTLASEASSHEVRVFWRVANRLLGRLDR